MKDSLPTRPTERQADNLSRENSVIKKKSHRRKKTRCLCSFNIKISFDNTDNLVHNGDSKYIIQNFSSVVDVDKAKACSNI